MTTRTKAELVLLAIALIYGGTFALCKVGLDYMSPFVFIATRFGLGALILGLCLRRRWSAIAPSTLRKGVVLGGVFGAGLALQIFGLHTTTASKSGFITGMFVAFTPIMQFLLLRRPPQASNLLGVGLVVIGLFFLTAPNGSGFNLGDALTLMAAVLFAMHVVFLDTLTHGEDALHLTFIQVVCAALIGLLLVPLETPRLAVTGELVGILFYMVILATVVTTYAFTRYQKETTPTRAAVLYSMEPVFAAVIARVLLGERLGTMGMLGASCIVGGILASPLSDSARKFFVAEAPGTVRKTLSAKESSTP